MKSALRKLIDILKPLSFAFDLLFLPLTVVASVWMRLIRYWEIKNFPLTRKVFMKLGVFPIVKHYYEPLFDYSGLKGTWADERELSCVDFNAGHQVELLKGFNFQSELAKFGFTKESSKSSYYYENGAFPSLDSDFLYSMIRKVKPKRIIEVGSGFSTLVMIDAMEANKNEVGRPVTELICIEPYEHKFLEELGIEVRRTLVENTDLSFFESLEENDFLFVDSSHMIRPQGDVLFEVFEILPKLKPGVFVHFHDIFTPRDYPDSWLKSDFRFWNEQYLLEAFLAYNKDFQIVGALNYLRNHFPKELEQAFPVLKEQPERQPGSLWIQKIR